MSIGRAPPSAARGQPCTSGAGPGLRRGGPAAGRLSHGPRAWGPGFRADLDDPRGGLNLPSGLLGAELAHPLEPPLVVTGSFADTGIRV